MNENFMFNNETGKLLYQKYAKDLPIIDFHCHLDPQEIANNKTYENIYEMWVNKDHYKWRQLRTFGIDEEYITGNKTPKEKFNAFKTTLPYMLKNPLHHWASMELKKYFDLDLTNKLCQNEQLYELLNTKIQNEKISAQTIINKSNVEVICTTDDPLDDLIHHQNIKNSNFKTKVYPTFRPDRFFFVNENYTEIIKELENKTIKINTLEDFINALIQRLTYFKEQGCFIVDHGFKEIPFAQFELTEVQNIFQKIKKQEKLTKNEEHQYNTYLLTKLTKKYVEYNMVMQIHYGALRNVNEKMFTKLGADSGYDVMGDELFTKKLTGLLSLLENNNTLPKTIIYNLNPIHNDALATIIGAFQGSNIKGKIQFGTAWWFNDQHEGMKKQINTLANLGLITTFIGMLTDSRSFLSFVRHDYFRRILCNEFGNWIKNQEIENDELFIGQIIQDICYYNAYNYFDLNKN